MNRRLGVRRVGVKLGDIAVFELARQPSGFKSVARQLHDFLLQDAAE